MKKYEVIFTDRHTEVLDHDTVDKMIDELEMFERDDVSQIHLLKDNGDFDTIWTEEEGLFVSDFGYDTRDDLIENPEIYPTPLLNQFYLELFSTDFRDCESPTQNSKTDYLFDYDNFTDWFENLISVFVDDTMCDENQLRSDLKNCKQFIDDMKTEYENLLELCSDYED